MNTTTPANTFWRLMGDYERLTQDEGAALGGGDFEAAEAAQARKPVLLAQLADLAVELGLDQTHPQLRDRLEVLVLGEKRNQDLVERMLHETAAQRQKLEVERARVRGFGQAYRPGTRRAEQFSAQG